MIKNPSENPAAVRDSLPGLLSQLQGRKKARRSALGLGTAVAARRAVDAEVCEMVSGQLGLWHRCQIQNASGLPEQVVEVVELFMRANSAWP